MDQGRQASGEDDAAELTSVPVQRGAALVESNRLQSGESKATGGAAQEDRGLVVDQLAAAVSEDRRDFSGYTCSQFSYAGFQITKILTKERKNHVQQEKLVCRSSVSFHYLLRRVCRKRAGPWLPIQPCKPSGLLCSYRKSTRLNSSH